jgi:hypothetical protein
MCIKLMSLLRFRFLKMLFLLFALIRIFCPIFYTNNSQSFAQQMRDWRIILNKINFANMMEMVIELSQPQFWV